MTKPIRKSNAPDPEKYALSGSEDAIQIALFMFCAKPDVRELYPQLRFMFAIPNGGYRGKAEAGRLKAMGVKAGVPDIFLPVPRGPWHGLFIELKRPKIAGRPSGRTSDEQNIWIAEMKKLGYGAIVCTGFDEARRTIIQYLEYGNEQANGGS